MSNHLLQTPIEYLKGIGPSRGELLRKELMIHRYGDLINLFPNRYIDRTRYFKINQLQNTTAEVQVIGKIIHIKTVEFGKINPNSDLGHTIATWLHSQVKQQFKNSYCSPKGLLYSFQNLLKLYLLLFTLLYIY